MPPTPEPETFRIALAQANPTVGDVAGNLAIARRMRAQAAAGGADLVLFPELFLSGYPPEDLVLKRSFLAACRAACEELARDTADGGPDVLIGLPWTEGGVVTNAVAHLGGGRAVTVRHKVELPNYGVFDEKRVFAPGALPSPISIRGVRVGAPICEDVWTDEVVECLAETGADILLVANGSPYWRGKHELRLNVATRRVVESGLPLVYLNQVGGQDDLVFDGASFGLNPDRTLAFQMRGFVEELAVTAWRRGAGGWTCAEGPRATLDEGERADYRACVLGLRDYVAKTGFPGVALGLSGGVDSALCAAIAVDALGAEKVRCVMLPYRFTSQESLEDAADCAKRLSVDYEVLPIAAAVEGFEAVLAPVFEGRARDVIEENLQSRARGALMMAISNKTGAMVVTTGNKSEMSVGYATLYGDMNGGFNPIKDLYKTEVLRLCRLRNAWKPDDALGPDGEVIPVNIIDKPPTAELREKQRDADSLPPYDELDPILAGLVERDASVAELVAEGHDETTVRRVERLVYLAEYKRRQSAPGVKVTPKDFGRDRRYPIVNRFRDEA